MSGTAAHVYLSVPESGDPAWPGTWARALATERELRFPARRHHPSPRALLVGGTRPDVLGRELPELVRRVLGAGGGEDLGEWTVEVDDPSLPEELVRAWVKGGVNRLSLRGTAARPDAVARLFDLVHALRPPRPVRIAAEVSLGGRGRLQGQLGADVEHTLDALLAAGTTSVALVEEDPVSPSDSGSPDGRDPGAWLRAIGALGRAGWTLSDLAFAHAPGVGPRYPRALARRHPVLGLGPGAISFRHPHRRWNHPDVATYLAAVNAGRDPVAGEEVLAPDEEQLERIWAALRTDAGLRLPARTCEDEPWLRRWREAGWLRSETPTKTGPRRLRLSPAGWLLADDLAVELALVVERIRGGGRRMGPGL